MVHSNWIKRESERRGYSRLTRLALSILLAVIAVAGIVADASGSEDSSAATQRIAPKIKPLPESVDCCVRAQDEIWFVSTRHLGFPLCSEDDDVPRLVVRQYDCDQGWICSRVEEFLSAESGLIGGQITLFYVHGNRKQTAESYSDGWFMYRKLVCQAPNAPPIRFVIWSWPSEKYLGPRRDVRTKAERTSTDGMYLGWVLSHLNLASKVSLVGHSFGARIILGALHVSAGGRLCGMRLTDSDINPAQPPVRVVINSAAEHSSWLAPGACHSRAYHRLDGMLNLYNSSDPILHHYRIVDSSRPDAMGFYGASGIGNWDDGGARVEQWDIRCIVGRTHSSRAPYNTYLIDDIRRCAFWQ